MSHIDGLHLEAGDPAHIAVTHDPLDLRSGVAANRARTSVRRLAILDAFLFHTVPSSILPP